MLFYFSGVVCIITNKIDSEVALITGSITLIAYGIIKIIGYFSNDLFNLAFQYDFACGVFLIML